MQVTLKVMQDQITKNSTITLTSLLIGEVVKCD